MKFFTLLLAAAPALASFEIPNPARQAKYDNGAVHNSLMATKNAFFDAAEAAGAYRVAYPTVAKHVPCENGVSVVGDDTFRCNNVDFHYFASHQALGSSTGRGSSSWGWTHEGREYAIIAQADGAAFAEVTKEGHLDYLGRLPNTNGSTPEIWRELRVLDDLLVVGSESVGHHVQIFDLKKLLAITPEEKPKTFHPWTDLTGIFTGLPVGRTHNIVVNADRKYAVAVGAQPRTHAYKSGLIFIDLKDPSNPTLAGVQSDDGYVHDAQCLLYKGPDPKYQGIDICYGFNEDTLTIYDVSNLANATIISRTGYFGAEYTHQGWVLDKNDQTYLIVDDEYDEYRGTGLAKDGFPITYIWDIRDLEHPKQTGHYRSEQYGIDHNQYIKGKRSYQSHYGNGLRIIDVSSIPSDPTGAGVKEHGFFDVYPENDNQPNGGSLAFVGSWSSYALFESGWIIVNTMERGAFVVRETKPQAGYA